MISHRHRCIYLKVPKCASTSVRDWFVAHAGARHSFPPYWYGGTLARRLEWVARAMEMYPGYLTFAFVRDPYRRFLSLYRHAGRVAAQKAERFPGHPADYGTLAQFAVLCEELLEDTGELWGAPADAFFRENADRRYGPLGVRLRHAGFLFTHARPQADFLPDRNGGRLFGRTRRNRAPLGFLGAVETLEEDFERLKRRAGLPAAPLPRRNASGPGPAPRYDEATRRRVARMYARDLPFAAASARSRTPAAAAGTEPLPEASPLQDGEPLRPASPAPDAEPFQDGELLRDASPVPDASPVSGRRVLGRVAYGFATREIALEARLMRVGPLRRCLAPVARRIRRIG